MTGNAPLVISVALGVLLVAAFTGKKWGLIGGVFQRDRRGRLTLILTPAKKKKRKRK